MTHQQFLKDLAQDDWDNHRIILWLALEQTKTGDVVELGCGDGSTRQLHEYCRDAKRKLHSFETDPEWIKRFIHLEWHEHKFYRILNDWDRAKTECPNPSVILVDNAPGHSRADLIKWYSDFTGIMVIHDSQPPPTAADYRYETIWHYWKYKVDLQVDRNPTGDNRTWATAVSNTFDVRLWAGIETGRPDYRIA